MGIVPEIVLTGEPELQRLLQRLPQEAAGRLQAVVVKNHLEHRDEIIRSSGFSPQATRNLRHAIRVFPRSRRQPRRIEDVEAGTASWWRGADIEDPAEGVAARVEKRVGSPVTKPRRRRYLLIPWGDYLTPSGRPRRERRSVGGRSVLAPILIRELPGTRIVRGRDGKLRVVQRLPAGQRGRFESGIRGVRGKRLGDRERVVGILVRDARVVQGLDFFGSWERLEGRRDDRYDRMLEALVR